MNYKHLYSKSLDAMGAKLHFASHSHHLWPDCVMAAQNQYILDAFTWADEKWSKAVAPLESKLQTQLADLLSIDSPNQICFAPNVHTLFFRLVSCFDLTAPLRILTTDSEFYSFSRQAQRLGEYEHIDITEIPTLSFASFKERILAAIQNRQYNMIYISQVFFNSGLAVLFLGEIIEACPEETMIVVDGYHGFGAIPTDLSLYQDRIFYLAGGYKYLQSGEGVCFMTVPRSANQYRPLYTGWFAEFDSLDQHERSVNYAPDARRFLGATTDPSGLYRMHSVLNLWQEHQLSVSQIHAYVQQLQEHFLSKVTQQGLFGLSTDALIHVQEKSASYGHFLTFRTPDALSIQNKLRQLDIITDSREDRLRFGFGLYQETSDIDQLFQRIADQD
ncbi:aminotransferase class V-fold PLP-dependent enzyme [Reichenbachiella agariperforans]|uniref:aminotransferase class V-fold PLP-dependent enzyme n=1 Tax=Reichenbachiella agariperforans TaxID=156994 RepID=UPI001C09F7EA|nr:aminotransferase class V-fold PLP-dependent enzyme [Reichenbachiella agariperforans]MBU2915156.1 aminotransferase class V-fold PLP-dependent enzyme [Reichenbachiella agariperforans]